VKIRQNVLGSKKPNLRQPLRWLKQKFGDWSSLPADESKETKHQVVCYISSLRRKDEILIRLLDSLDLCLGPSAMEPNFRIRRCYGGAGRAGATGLARLLRDALKHSS
jgi:hypothetical protein